MIVTSFVSLIRKTMISLYFHLNRFICGYDIFERDDFMAQKKSNYPKKGYPPYDDDRFYDIKPVVSAHDCTGLEPTPPISEYQAESYSDLMNATIPKGEVDNGFQRERPQDVKKK